MPTLSHLFAPLTIRGMTLKNRIVMPPMGTRYPTYGGAATPKLAQFYAERARGGVGLIIVQFTSISPEGASSLYPLGIWDDTFVPGLRTLVDQVHEAGARVSIQLAHAGGNTSSALTQRPVLAPSAVPCLGRETPREISRTEIARVVDAFAQAARRATEAGFDAIELHMAHGYLINQFLSPLFNRRTDEYGGSLESRALFALQVLRATRQLIGDAVPILCRLNADDAVPGSFGLDEACRVASWLAAEGADVIDVTAGIGESFEVSAPPMSVAPGSLLPYAAAIKQAVSVPVIAVGRLDDPELAERVLAEGKADLIAVGRGLIADPAWARKAAQGRLDDIRPCLACNRPECHGRVLQQLDLSCVVNPAAGREAHCKLSSAAQPRRILVIGGGPAGLEVARVAALRGHRVILCEQGPVLGGQLWLAAAPPHKADMKKLIGWLSNQVIKLGVDARLNCRMTAELAAELAAEAIVLASGARPLVPPIPGADSQAVTAWDVLAGKVEVGRRVAIVGGGDVGCETAEYLAAHGREVTILEMLPEVAPQLSKWTHRMLLERLRAGGVEILLQARVLAIEPGRLTFDRQGISGVVAPVDSIVLAIGARSENALAPALEATGATLFTIGDARKPGTLAEAIRAGFELGRSL